MLRLAYRGMLMGEETWRAQAAALERIRRLPFETTDAQSTETASMGGGLHSVGVGNGFLPPLCLACLCGAATSGHQPTSSPASQTARLEEQYPDQLTITIRDVWTEDDPRHGPARRASTRCVHPQRIMHAGVFPRVRGCTNPPSRIQNSQRRVPSGGCKCTSVGVPWGYPRRITKSTFPKPKLTSCKIPRRSVLKLTPSSGTPPVVHLQPPYVIHQAYDSTEDML